MDEYVQNLEATFALIDSLQGSDGTKEEIKSMIYGLLLDIEGYGITPEQIFNIVYADEFLIG